MSNKFESKDGEQDIAQGDHAIGKQRNTYGIPTEAVAKYEKELNNLRIQTESLQRVGKQKELEQLLIKLKQLSLQAEKNVYLSITYIDIYNNERKK